MDLFEYAKSKTLDRESPLASRLRPTTLDEVVGQEHIVGKDKLLYRAIKADKLTSVIFYQKLLAVHRKHRPRRVRRLVHRAAVQNALFLRRDDP